MPMPVPSEPKRIAEKRAAIAIAERMWVEYALVDKLEEEYPQCTFTTATVGEKDNYLFVCCTVPKFSDYVAPILRRLAALGYTQEGSPNLSKESGTRTYFLGRIRICFSSSACKLVLVRTETREVPVYEHECE